MLEAHQVHPLSNFSAALACSGMRLPAWLDSGAQQRACKYRAPLVATLSSLLPDRRRPGGGSCSRCRPRWTA